MSMLYKSAENSKARLMIKYDDSPTNPREWDNLGTMICFHKKYNLGDEHSYDGNDYNGWDEMEKAIIKNEDVLIILPLYLYDHSGITMNTTGYSCPWDSGQVGFIYISKEKVREEYKCKRISKRLRDIIKIHLENEIKTYDHYLTGDTYGFVLEEIDKCECCGEITYNEINSCWGFFGQDINENGIKDYIPKDYHDLISELF